MQPAPDVLEGRSPHVREDDGDAANFSCQQAHVKKRCKGHLM